MLLSQGDLIYNAESSSLLLFRIKHKFNQMCERTVTDVFSEIITSNKTLDIGSHCFDVRKHLVIMVSCNYANL